MAFILWINTSKKGPLQRLVIFANTSDTFELNKIFGEFFLSSVRSPESDTKLERNIAFIAEVLARHIFNFTTKVSYMTQVMFNQFILYDVSRWPLRAENIIILAPGHK